jgi:hypothetical protein
VVDTTRWLQGQRGAPAASDLGLEALDFFRHLAHDGKRALHTLNSEPDFVLAIGLENVNPKPYP